MAFKEKDKVLYTGVNRPVLKDWSGVVSRTSTFNNSALVDFYDDKGRHKATEWVGEGALKLVEGIPSIEEQVKKELAVVQSEYAEAYKKYTDLRNRKTRLEGALAALTSNYR